MSHAGDPEVGRDRQVLHALRASGVPFFHLVFGPGCDGESEIDAMCSAMREADSRGELAGVMPLAPLGPVMAGLASPLKASRTPNIIARALAREAERQEGAAATDDGSLCTIERHGGRMDVPWSWLTVAVALKDAEAPKPAAGLPAPPS